MSEIVAAISQNYAAGDDLLLRLYVTRDGVALDMTGMSFSFVVARRLEFEPVLSTESTIPTASIVELNATYNIDVSEGSFGVSIAGTDTIDLNGTYEFVSRVTDGLGQVATVARGFLTFTTGPA
jgi:hypothetical protein